MQSTCMFCEQMVDYLSISALGMRAELSAPIASLTLGDLHIRRVGLPSDCVPFAVRDE
jgi:hypothetical protein